MAGAALSTEFDLSRFSEWALATGRNIENLSWEKPLKVCNRILISYTKQNFAAGRGPDGQSWPPLVMSRPRGGDKPLRDRGLLMASVTSQRQGNIHRLTPKELVWGTNLDYAATHQHGAVIRPTKAKALAIPLSREAYRAGSPRNMTGLFIFRSSKSRTGRSEGFLVEAKGKGRRLVFHYMLKAQVKIPARPFLGLNEPMLDDMTEAFWDYLGEVFR